MLVLSRRVGEAVMVGDNIVVTILGVRGKQVRVGFEAPRGIPIRRQEKDGHDEPTADEAATANNEWADSPQS